MPEGHVIHAYAERLATLLVGRVIERVTTQGLVRDLAGRTITAVTAIGKHLVLDLDDQTRIRTHLGMTGRVRHYPRADGDAIVARTSPGHTSLVIASAEITVVWITAKTVEILPRRALHRDAVLAALGPDVLGADFDPAAAAARAAARGPRNICDVLVDQHVAAGIGNIFKAESLFACKIDPQARVDQIDAATLVQLFVAARALMSRADGDWQVYGRTRQPCRVCTTPIAVASLGEPPRWTWWCPTCQPAAGQ
jgi:endonuclease-8